MFSAALIIVFVLVSGIHAAQVGTNETCRSVVYNVQSLNQNSCCNSSVHVPASTALDDVKQQLASLQAKFQAFEAASKKTSPIIGFNVAMNKNQANGPATIEFGDIISHYGNCWNTATNTFIAPVTGLYSFTLTLMNMNDQRTAWASLMHENKELGRAYCTGTGSHTIGSAAAVVKVTKGQHVFGRLRAGTLHSATNTHWSSFVGFLVHKM